MKTIVTVVLLVFVAASIAYVATGERRDSGEEIIEANAADAPVAETARVGAADGVADHSTTEHSDSAMAPAREPGEAGNPSRQPAADERRLIVYYFHRTQRCHTCLTMEAYARAALDEDLFDAMESGELKWRAVNVDETANEHFVNEYELYASALVMVEREGDEVKRSKKLEQIWDLVGDEWKFRTFVRDEALAYLEDTP